MVPMASFTPGVDLWDVNANGDELERPLFERLKRGELNGFERDVALYLDGRDATAWWWRIASRGPWGLQGWRRNRVYPDFLIRFNGAAPRMMVLETKGQQLGGNADTQFKTDLMAKLQAAYVQPSPGEVELFVDAAEEIRFQMLMQADDWRSALAKATPNLATVIGAAG